MRFHHFDEQGFVSIWAGGFPSEEVRVEHLRERYGDDDEPLAEWMGEFGFLYFNHDFQDTNGDGLTTQPLRELLAPCSYAASFLDEAIGEADHQGISKTQFVSLLYDFRYDPEVTGVRQGRYLRFLGAFRYSVQYPEWLQRLCGEEQDPERSSPH